MIRTLRAFCLIAATIAGVSAMAETRFEILRFADLDGWQSDDHSQALSAFLNTCGDLAAPEWKSICELAKTQDPAGARAFFELFFKPVLIDDGDPALFTGYFEPELNGARAPSGRYRYPVYRMPPEARTTNPWLTRRQILAGNVLAERGLEIAWVDDPVELFFLQIQGSGRIDLPGGKTLRVGYAGANGHPYRSIGVELVRRGVMKSHQVSARMIRNWVRNNPDAGRELLFHNPSYVFFRELKNVAPEKGPLGAMNRSVTPMRTVAVDPKFTPLGAPVWIEKNGANRMRRLMIAQDTGSAIKGAQRADIFFGTGDKAGDAAGELKDPGRMVVLLPIQQAYALDPEGV